MNDFEPIDIEILINEPQVTEAAAAVADSLHGIGSAADDALKKVTANTGQISKAVALAASQLQATTSKGGVSVIYPTAALDADKKNVQAFVDDSKQQLAALAEANKFYGVTPNTSTAKATVPYSQGAPVAVTTPTASAQDVLGKQFSDVLAMGQDAFKALDAQTQQYMLSLIDLQTALSTVTQAESGLTKAFNDGKISEDEYTASLANLQSAHEVLTNEIDKLTTVQQTYLTLNDLENSTLKEKKAALEQLKAEYDSLTETQQQNEEIGGRMQQQMTELSASINQQSETVTKGISILTEYRNLRNKIASDAVNGIVNPADIQKAAQLEQAIKNTNAQLQLSANNVSGIKAIGDGVQGLVGAFTAASGVISLFTDDNTKAQKILQDTVAVMFAFNGAQQAAQILNKNSSVNLYIKNLLSQQTAIEANTVATVENTTADETNAAAKEANATATAEQIAATEAQTVATDGATAAQWSLNAAVEANPLGLLLAAVGLVVTAWIAFGNSADDAEKKQAKLNQTLLDAQKILNQMNDIAATPYKEQVSAAENQLALAQAMGKTGTELKSYQDNVIAARTALNGFNAGAAGVTGTLAQQKQQLHLLQAELEDALQKVKAAGDNKDLKAAAQSSVDLLQDQVNTAQKIVDEKIKIQSDAATQQAQFAQQQQQKDLQSDTAYWQSKVTLAQKGSKDWLDAQLGLNAATYNKTVSQPDVTAGESKAAAATRYEADLEAYREYNTQKLQDDRDTISAQLDAATEGSAEELALKLRDLEDYTQQQIIAAKSNTVQIEKINADSQKKQDDLKKQYEQTQLNRLIDLQKNIATVQLAQLPKNSEAYLDWTKQQNINTAQGQVGTAIADASKLHPLNPFLSADAIRNASSMNEQAALEFADKVESIDANLAERIRAIWAETNEKNKESDDVFMEQKIQQANKLVEISANIAKTPNNAVIADPNSSQQAKAQAQINNNNIDLTTTAVDLQNIINEVSKGYSATGASLSDYIAQTERDFSKIKDLSNTDSPISVMLDKIPGLKDQVQQLLTKFQGFKDAGAVLKKQLDDIKTQNIFDLLQSVSKLGDALSKAGGSWGDFGAAISGAGKELKNIQLIMTDTGNKVTNTYNKIEGSINAASDLLDMFISSASERKQEMEEYYQSVIAYQNAYNLSLDEQVRLQTILGESVFLRDYVGEVQDATKEINDLEPQIAKAITDLQKTGQAISGKRNAVDWGNVAKGAASGAAIGTAILPGVGTVLGGIAGAIGGLFGGKKKKDTLTPLLQEYPELLQKTSDGVTEINEDLAKQLISQNLVNDATKTQLQNVIDLQDEYTAAQKQITDIVSDLAGSLSSNIQDALVTAFENGTDAAQAFGQSVEDVLQNIIASLLFQEVFSQQFKDLQDQMTKDFMSTDPTSALTATFATFFQAMSAGLSTYNAALAAAKDQAKAAGLDIFGPTNQQQQTLSGEIQQQITEQTADELAGITRGQYDEIIRQTDILYSQANSLAAIQINTAAAVTQLQTANDTLTQIQKNTKPAATGRDIGI